VAAGLSVPGDPDALDELVTALGYSAQAAGRMSTSTAQLTSTVLAGWPKGEGSTSFDTYGTNLAAGMGRLQGVLDNVTSAVKGYSPFLRAAQQAAADYNSAAATAQNDSSGLSVTDAEQAWGLSRHFRLSWLSSEDYSQAAMTSRNSGRAW
jgi:hypothetical protein